MKTLMYVIGLLSVPLSFACAGDESSPDDPDAPSEVVLEPFECVPLEGVYNIIYAKRSGDCADLPEQLAFFDDRGSTSALNDECEATVSTSEDACDREEDAACPVISATGANVGNAKLVTAFTQTSASRIEGMATIEISTYAGTACSATYALIGSKIEE